MGRGHAASWHEGWQDAPRAVRAAPTTGHRGCRDASMRNRDPAQARRVTRALEENRAECKAA